MAHAAGKYARAISDRSGLEFPYKEMVKEWNGSLVHKSEFESKHPQLERQQHKPDGQSLQDAGNYENELEVPTRFLPCLTSGLAYYTSVKKAPERTPLLKQLYEEEWQRASEEDRPRSSFFAVPERGYM